MKRKFEVGMFFILSSLIISCGSSDSATGPDAEVRRTARPLPDTRDGIYIWADQLDAASDVEDRFIAENYVASQKLTKDRIDRIRTYNPNFVVVQYHKAYGVDQGGNIIEANEWGPDISKLDAYIASHPEEGEEEDYYFHWEEDGEEKRVEHFYREHMEHYLADIRHEGFRKYVTKETMRRCRVVGFDGTFFDVAYFPWYDYNPRTWYEYPPLSWPSIPGCGELWNEIAVPYWQYVNEAYHSDGNDYYCLTNCDQMVTGWYLHAYLDYIDGAMSEGFMTFGGGLTGGDWELSASRILRYLTGNGKILIAQPSIDPAHIELREWCIANYLLLKNDKSFYYNVHTGYAPSWWPEYDIDLGPYLQTPTQNLADLLVPGTTSLYAREFEKGLVLVNPGSLEQQYTLSDTLGRYAFSGGGSLVEGQKPDMELEVAQEVSGKIAVPPGRGMILSREIGR